VVPLVHAVPYGVRMLRRSTLFPDESVLLSFEIAKMAVPVALDAPVVWPSTDTR
jgi:hypothetical protein